MRIDPSHLSAFDRDGFVVIPGFFAAEECRAALEAFHAEVAPPYDRWVADGRPATSPRRGLFPFDDPRLNRLSVHPDLIAAAERIIGTVAIRLADVVMSVRYGPDTVGNWYHDDHGNNTLGPRLARDRSNIVFFVLLTDVEPGMAPIMMVPDGRTDAEAIPVIAPAGTVCIYSAISTRHSASPFTASAGERVIASICYSRADRPWDGGRTFSYKGGAGTDAMSRFLGEATPRQRELLGFPPPGDPLWSDEFLAAMALRYAGFDSGPYRAARRPERQASAASATA
jgi:hypothetical protein